LQSAEKEQQNKSIINNNLEKIKQKQAKRNLEKCKGN